MPTPPNADTLPCRRKWIYIGSRVTAWSARAAGRFTRRFAAAARASLKPTRRGKPNRSSRCAWHAAQDTIKPHRRESQDPEERQEEHAVAQYRRKTERGDVGEWIEITAGECSQHHGECEVGQRVAEPADGLRPAQSALGGAAQPPDHVQKRHDVMEEGVGEPVQPAWRPQVP